MKKVLLILSVSAALVACNKNEKADVLLENTTTTDTTAVSDANTATVTSAPANVSAAPLNTSSAPLQVTAGQPQNIQPSVGQQNITTAPGMNPPHGQPNHRCDIPVGAPLSTPVQNNAQQASSLPQTTVPAPATVIPQPSGEPVVTAPGMNPPHGQPNHRCDIPVGAPLSSK